MIRKILCGVILLLALFFAYVTLTVPTFAATAPAIITIALCVLLYFVWPRRRNNAHA